MNQKLKKILTKSLIIFGILIPTVTVSTSLVLSCSSSNDSGGNPDGSEGSGSGGSGGSNDGGSSGGSGSNGGATSKKIIDFTSTLRADPDTQNGQYVSDYDSRNLNNAVIYFESMQKEKELLQLREDFKNNKIKWYDEENNKPIKYQLKIKLNSGLSIGYGDTQTTPNWDYLKNCYRNVGDLETGVTNVNVIFYIDDKKYNPGKAPLRSDFIIETNALSQYTNSTTQFNNDYSFSIWPPIKEWYYFLSDLDLQYNGFWSYSLALNGNLLDKDRCYIYLDGSSATIQNKKEIANYGFTIASDNTIFDNADPNLSRLYVSDELAIAKYNAAKGANSESTMSNYFFKGDQSNIGTFSIKQI